MLATLIFPLWFSSAWRPSNVELYVLNSVYLEGNGAELATRGDVGVLSFVTDGDFVVGVHEDVVGVWANLAGFVIVGELKSNDNRDLWDTKYEFDVRWMTLKGMKSLTLVSWRVVEGDKGVVGHGVLVTLLNQCCVVSSVTSSMADKRDLEHSTPSCYLHTIPRC